MIYSPTLNLYIPSYPQLGMAMSKKDLEKRFKDKRSELEALEAKCKDGGGTKEDYEALAKLRRKMK